MATIDYDLDACLEYNPQEGITPDTIDRVLAVWQGENDGDSWRWVLALTDGRFAYVNGWCDYTGWDCRSDAESVFVETPELGAAEEKNALVRTELLRQVHAGKDETWRERKDREFGVTSGGS